MRAAGVEPVVTVLPVGGRKCGKPDPDAFTGRTIYPDALLRSLEDDRLPAPTGASGEPQASQTFVAEDGARSLVPEAQHQRTKPGT